MNELWNWIMHRSKVCDNFDTWLSCRCRPFRKWRRREDAKYLSKFINTLIASKEDH